MAPCIVVLNLINVIKITTYAHIFTMTCVQIRLLMQGKRCPFARRDPTRIGGVPEFAFYRDRHLFLRKMQLITS